MDKAWSYKLAVNYWEVVQGGFQAPGGETSVSSWKLRYQVSWRWETKDYYKISLTIGCWPIHWLSSLILGWVLSPLLCNFTESWKLFSSNIKQNTTYSTSLGRWMKIMECTRICSVESLRQSLQVWTLLNFSTGRWDKHVLIQIPSVHAWAPDTCISGQVRHLEDVCKQ